jgi:hypothetical protein
LETQGPEIYHLPTADYQLSGGSGAEESDDSLATISSGGAEDEWVQDAPGHATQESSDHAGRERRRRRAPL